MYISRFFMVSCNDCLYGYYIASSTSAAKTSKAVTKTSKGKSDGLKGCNICITGIGSFVAL